MKRSQEEVLQWYWQLLTGVKLTQQQILSLIDSTPEVCLDPPATGYNVSLAA
jgi:hypothetical protein